MLVQIYQEYVNYNFNNQSSNHPQLYYDETNVTQNPELQYNDPQSMILQSLSP